jgi:hypothetical protein
MYRGFLEGTDVSSKHLAACVPPIDLIICDEGQRLKSKDNKTTKMFEQLKTPRRIRKSRQYNWADLSPIRDARSERSRRVLGHGEGLTFLC